ncbi:hypothetical protein IAQ61_007905, partial [Plenodomus lingam]|uniref:Predicted protein n=1 Tax=Leptosphaeria maculans (strain JN3 / isolate v23.1.3 / race Av1-4-5-6-7-8) TaxID=985895 RepID=E4ZZP8_LEPMJ
MIALLALDFAPSIRRYAKPTPATMFQTQELSRVATTFAGGPKFHTRQVIEGFGKNATSGAGKEVVCYYYQADKSTTSMQPNIPRDFGLPEFHLFQIQPLNRYFLRS